VTVEGGAISSRNGALIQRIRKMRNYGIEANYDAHYPGLNGKMSEFHAIIGVQNMLRLPERLTERTRKAAYYADQIEERARSRVLLAPADVTHTYKDFSVVVPPEMKTARDRIIQFMAKNGVETRAYFSPPVHQQRYFQHLADRPLPVTEDLAQRVITLPFFTTICQEEMDYVARVLAAAETETQGNGA
jgi:dTDP-4-amino-4,6-dideoxygalactose transaminase